MGWGWCSGTALWGDLAISRGVDVSFRSCDALLDERLPVGTGQGGLASGLRGRAVTAPNTGSAEARGYGRPFEGRLSGIQGPGPCLPLFLYLRFCVFHLLTCFCVFVLLKNTLTPALLCSLSFTHSNNQKIFTEPLLNAKQCSKNRSHPSGQNRQETWPTWSRHLPLEKGDKLVFKQKFLSDKCSRENLKCDQNSGAGSLEPP